MVTVAFDTFLDEFLLTILNGVPVVFADDLQYKDTLELIPLIKKTNANVFDGTPSRLLQYLEMDELKDLIANFKIFVMVVKDSLNISMISSQKSLTLKYLTVMVQLRLQLHVMINLLISLTLFLLGHQGSMYMKRLWIWMLILCLLMF